MNGNLDKNAEKHKNTTNQLIEWTGERFVPWLKEGPPDIHYEHLHRYYFASQFVEGKRVLDLASGEGYGSAILARKALSVIGVEIDGNVVKHASRRYSLPNLKFVEGSITDIPLEEENSFDIITCFEAIEHIVEHERLLSEVKRLLKEDGLFILSSPNKLLYSDQQNYQNPYHLKELYFNDLRKLLNAYFPYALFLGQKVQPVSSIWPLGIQQGGYKDYCIQKTDSGFIKASSNDKVPIYFLAIVSMSPLPEEFFFSSLTDISEEYSKYYHRAAEEREQLISKQLIEERLQFQQQLVDKEQQLLSLELLLKEKETILVSKEIELVENQQHLISIQKENESFQRQQRSEFEHQLSLLQGQLLLMENALGWRIIKKYRSTMDRLFPLNSRRRKLYGLIQKSVKAILFEGHSALVRKATSSTKKTQENIVGETILPKQQPRRAAIIIDKEVATMDVAVSVVIPTKNAGDSFRYLLSMLRNQKGIRQIEIILVDSGSTDNTLEIARQFDARIIEINPEQFSHSYARNLGAEAATGEYILFTVQDALPSSDSWLNELYQALKNKGVTAVTCRESPLFTSDLFYRVALHNHFKEVLNLTEDKVMSQPPVGDYVMLRKNAQLSNVACLISKDVFLQYKFRGNYGEDLDLGIRLIEEGHKLALLNSTAVLHSHNRQASYYLARGYVNCLFLCNRFSDFPRVHLATDKLFRDILFTYYNLRSIIDQKLYSIKLPCSVKEFTNIIAQQLQLAITSKYPSRIEVHNVQYLDDAFILFLKDIVKKSIIDEDNLQYDGVLIYNILDHVRLMAEYMDITYDLVDNDIYEECIAYLYKCFGVSCGEMLASCHLDDPGSQEEYFERIDHELCRVV